MRSTTKYRSAEHRLKLGENYYDLAIARTDRGFEATWSCLKCHGARRLDSESAEDVEEQALASIEAHHLLFHGCDVLGGLHHEWHSTTTNRDTAFP